MRRLARYDVMTLTTGKQCFEAVELLECEKYGGSFHLKKLLHGVLEIR